MRNRPAKAVRMATAELCVRVLRSEAHNAEARRLAGMVLNDEHRRLLAERAASPKAAAPKGSRL